MAEELKVVVAEVNRILLDSPVIFMGKDDPKNHSPAHEVYVSAFLGVEAIKAKESGTK